MKFAIFEGALSPNQNTTVLEVVDEVVTVDGVEHGLRDRYHPSLVATMRRCPDDTVPGTVYDIVNDTWTAPEVVATSDVGNGEPPPKNQ